MIHVTNQKYILAYLVQLLVTSKLKKYIGNHINIKICY